MHTLRVWDLPTRVFHWSLTLCVLGLLFTSQIGGDWMNAHILLGYTVFSLLLFRLVWGICGGYWSRFAQFIYSPCSFLAYLRGTAQPAHVTGHNPLGALSVFALLLILSLQVGSGLFSDDEIAFMGPLTHLVSHETVTHATRYHTTLGKWLVLAFVALHVLAILYYKLFKGQSLTTAMLTGDKQVGDPLPASSDSIRTRLWALAIWMVCALLVSALVRF